MDTPGNAATNSGCRILAIIGAAILGLAVLASIAGAILFILGLKSCSAVLSDALSDDPIHDTADNLAFIADTRANERDLATFDALRGCIDSLYQGRTEGGGDAASPDDIRASLVSGAWPSSWEGYNDLEGPSNPQLWVRLAELAQTQLEELTGETWAVLDFAYPYPNNGPIPVPPKRTENSRAETLLVCTSGADEGLCVCVSHFRWADPAHFETDLPDARDRREARGRCLGELSGIPALAGRSFLLSSSELFVWSTGEDDPLRDPQAFLALANEALQAEGCSAVRLVEQTRPTAVRTGRVSYDYPNQTVTQDLPFNQARESLLASSWRELDLAWDDALLRATSYSGEPVAITDLRGELAPYTNDDMLYLWYVPEEGAAFDQDITGAICDELGIGPEQVIATSSAQTNETFLDVYVILQRGAIPETSDGFLDAAARIRDAIWENAMPEGWSARLRVRLYLVDDTTITCDGVPASFADMRAAVMDDPQRLESYSFEVLISCVPWMSDRGPGSLSADETGGTIGRSEEWRQGGGQAPRGKLG